LALGTILDVCSVLLDGGLDAQTIRLEGNVGSRTAGMRGVIERLAGPDCVGVCIAEPYPGRFSSVEARFAQFGVAVLARELERRPWTTAQLARLMI
jgi:hypothetical protein